ncbi:kinesin-like protein Klp98A isoform X2 [Chrysoperla carnea]|uniref:kinesin-like protein Klp98A isoform X2 n=1 Tax=Chrysoperla carnea TaxID=189513 RepID=UPI001D081A0F|nr:kinesin-like protein Klp98A isoform X2 [Chrysoperla carnea]
MASLKVAVRVRPFNQRERDMNAKLIIQMDGKKTRVVNVKPPGKRDSDSLRDRYKEFTFDHSYWSFDAADSHYASQDQVFSDLGTEVVDSAFEGYNACVFAYGQTGSGKTFTMMGSGECQGLIPRICKNMFARMHASIASGNNYRTEVSYLEIYNERVKDLLQENTHHNLRVREHPERGIYVENLSTHLVSDYSDIQDCMVRGNRQRTTASTNMNDVSSRSHAIFTIMFIQAGVSNGVPSETVSKVHLVDLAGSERADATGATGQRLKEGAHINKSLVTLGSVISALAELCNDANNISNSTNSINHKSSRSVHIPYRDSVLTYLLKDSLGGNSKTIMIAAISPADCNYHETLSTLRYANRAKNIINKPTINEDPNVKLIKELRDEIAKLKALILNNNKMDNPIHVEPAMLEQLQKKQAQEKDLTEKWEEKWRQTQVILREERALGLRKSGLGVVLDSDMPHLVGIDDDLLSTGVTLYHLKEGETLIGTEDAPIKQDIVLNAVGVENEHCSVVLDKGVATIIPKQSAQVWVNAVLIDKPARLSQGCIIVLGRTIMFRYNDPVEAAKLRKEGSRSQLNLSRQSLLSWSTNDLATSLENLNTDNQVEFENLELQRATLEKEKENFAREQAERESDWAAEQQARREALEAAQKQLELERQKMEEEYQLQRRKLAEDWRKLEEKQQENELVLKKKQMELKRKRDLLEWERSEAIAQAEIGQKQVEHLENKLHNERQQFNQDLISLLRNLKIEFLDENLEKVLSKVQETPLSEESDFVVNLLKNADHDSIEAVKYLVNQHKKELASLEIKLQNRIQALTVERNNIHRIESELSDISQNQNVGAGGDAGVLEIDKQAINQRSKEEIQEITEKKQSMKLNLKHAALPLSSSTDNSTSIGDDDKHLHLSAQSPDECVSNKISTSSEDYSSPLKTCDTFHTATSDCSIVQSNINTPLSPEDDDLLLNQLRTVINGNNRNNGNLKHSVQNNNNNIMLITSTISPTKMLENSSSIPQCSDSDDPSSTDDYKVMSTEDGNSAQSSSSFEKVSPLENFRQRRRFSGSTNSTGRKYIGGEEAAVRAMKRLSQRMARQKMMILRNIETECSREELNEQIAVLQELQRQYVKLELALQNQIPNIEIMSEDEEYQPTSVLSPANKHPLSDESSPIENNLNNDEENQLFLGHKQQQQQQQSSFQNFHALNNLSSSVPINQQCCSKSLNEQSQQHSECCIPEQSHHHQQRVTLGNNGKYNLHHHSSLHSIEENKSTTRRYSTVSSDYSEDEPATVHYNGRMNGGVINSCYVKNQITDDDNSPSTYPYSLTRSLPTFAAYEINDHIVSVPTYVLRGAGTKTHFEYEVRINVQGEKWSILRRYRRFRELHLTMRSKYGPKIEAIPFPPRQLFASTSESLARERRTLLETYLRRLLAVCSTLPNCPLYSPYENGCSQSAPISDTKLSDCINRMQLLEFSAFFRRGIFENDNFSY